MRETGMVRGSAMVVMTAFVLSAMAQQAENMPVLHTGTKLVVVDVTVTDQSHHAVRGLKAEDFTLQENGAKQTVKNFEEHIPTAEALKPAAIPALKPGEFSNRIEAPMAEDGPVDVLLIDRLNTPMDSQTRLRTQLLDYLSKAKPGTRMAIFGLNTQLVLLQGFTSDPRLLRAVLDKKSNPRGSPMQGTAAASGGVDEASTAMLDAAAAWEGDDSAMGKSLAAMDAAAKLFDAQLQAQQDMDRGRLTLDAMNALARYLGEIPGRKNLVWFSGSFPLEILPDTDFKFMTVTDLHEEYRETVGLLSRAQVVLYPVDARGAAVIAPTTTVAGEGGSGEQYLRPGARGVNPLAKDMSKAMEKTFNENTTMRELAFDTGGQAFLDHNDLADVLAEALADGSSYYSLSYTPSNGDWRGEFRKIEVKLRQNGYELAYRRGYYADDTSVGAGNKTSAKMQLAVPGYGVMHLALMHAGPEPTDVMLTVQAAPVSGSPESVAAPGNTMRAGLKGPYRRYAVAVNTDAKTMAFLDEANGQHRAAAEIVTFVYDSDGMLVNGMAQTVAADLKPAVYDAVMKGGLPVRQEISVPEKGEYFLRVVVHDLNSDHVGAVEFPASAVPR